ncbi:MAG: ATP-binding protein [Peptostreptococcaceae bacterium]|nr:ATP-binding protein [Peptostreptococcaceae bacterium]
MLVAACNPCRCGYLGDSKHECICSSAQIQSYKSKLSGPIFDSIEHKRII